MNEFHRLCFQLGSVAEDGSTFVCQCQLWMSVCVDASKVSRSVIVGGMAAVMSGCRHPLACSAPQDRTGGCRPRRSPSPYRLSELSWRVDVNVGRVDVDVEVDRVDVEGVKESGLSLLGVSFLGTEGFFLPFFAEAPESN